MFKNDMPTIRTALPGEIQYWNELVIKNPDGGSFLQTREFASLKEKEHWESRYLIIETGHEKVAVLALCRYVFPLGELWYFPKGPGVSEYDDFKKVYQVCREYIVKNHPRVFLMQCEPEISAAITMETLRQDNLTLAPSIQSSSSTVILPLQDSIEDMLASVSKRARYYIRLGQREGIEAREVEPTEDNFRKV